MKKNSTIVLLIFILTVSFFVGSDMPYLLSEMPLDIIKLDRCFLHSNVLKAKEKIVIANIIRMTKELGMTSLCEGVETEQQSVLLKGIGCDIQQGYYFARPLCEKDFVGFIEA